MEKKKILIIDNEESFVQMMKWNLEETGNYEVRTETKGVRGLLAAREFKPDLIFLDIMMPDMAGGEVASQIESDKNVENIPILFLTAAITDTEVASHGGIIGGHEFLAKPVSTEEVIDCIEKHTQ